MPWRFPLRLVLVLTFVLAPLPVLAQEAGRDTYMQRCFWCHGEDGRGNGLSAVGMFPRPRDFVRADYKIRSTPFEQLPTDEDLLQVISVGMPGTPMPGWKNILTEKETRALVSYIKSFSPRFKTEKIEPLTVPDAKGSVERGRKVYQKARCYMCHGESGRGDGEITTNLNFEWGIPHAARDFTRGWAFKGGHRPRDIYFRIAGGLNGTPMGPYKDLFSEEELWDLAHYIVSLDQESMETSEDFLIAAALVKGEIPKKYDAPEWTKIKRVLVPLAGQIILDPPSRWWIPTTGTATVRALWNRQEIAFLLEWNDPTGPESTLSDSALLQFAAEDGGKPYFLFGDADNPVKVWQWQAGSNSEDWTAAGRKKIEIHSAAFKVNPVWEKGRWHVIFRSAVSGEPKFQVGGFIPTLISIRDGANGEFDNVRALSTWVYTTLERPWSPRPWLVALAYLLAIVIAEICLLSKLRTVKDEEV